MNSRPDRPCASRFPLRASLLLPALLALTPAGTAAQERGAAALGEAIAGLGVNMRVLMIAAHPDDEDTQVISWLSRGLHVETAYLSLTRGDGGQNAIGNELGEALGVLRTEELLAARRVDGGKQFFTRAYDYGFSKSAEEAFSQWPHDSLLRDVLTVVRAFRPHVIISVFSGTTRDGHGQHQAAGILAREAYDVSGDTVRHPRAVTGGHGGWTVSKFYRGGGFRRQAGTLRINVGAYDPLLGRSYAEIAAISRSQHRSQAFGTLQPLGVRMDALHREATRVPAPEDAIQERSIFDGIDTTWARLRGAVAFTAGRAALDSLPAALAQARSAFDAFMPHRSIAVLARVKALLNVICPTIVPGSACDPGSARPEVSDLGISALVTLGRLYEALTIASGVAVEGTLPRERWPVGEDVPIRPTIYNRGPSPITVLGGVLRIDSVTLRAGGSQNTTVAPDSSATLNLFIGGDGQRFWSATQPSWLGRPRRGAMFDYRVRGGEESRHTGSPELTLQLAVEGVGFNATVPVVYRYADQVRGEIRRPVVGVPSVSVLLDQELEYAPARTPIEREIRVHLRSAGAADIPVKVRLELPAGLRADSTLKTAELPQSGAVRTVTFTVRGQLPPGHHVLAVTATDPHGNEFSQGYTTIDYEHINPRRIYRASRVAIEAVDLVATGSMRVGYVQGVGDNSAAALAQLGMEVVTIDPATLPQADLRGFHAIVVGPRAYETNPVLVANNAHLLSYARDGGTLVVQYGQYEMQREGIMPYSVTINRPHDRVTQEGVPVALLDTTTTVLGAPNRITEADFEGWIQDRSLYMPRTFDPQYVPVLAMSDPGEPANRGAILVARYGRGTYVYTSLAFFRQLPNGVPGAARLFVNLLSARVTGTAQ